MQALQGEGTVTRYIVQPTHNGNDQAGTSKKQRMSSIKFHLAREVPNCELHSIHINIRYFDAHCTFQRLILPALQLPHQGGFADFSITTYA